MKTFNYLFLVITCCSLLLFGACGGGSDSDTATTTSEKKSDKKPGELKAAQGGKYYGGVFKQNEEEYLRTLYPLNVGEVVGHRITNQIYEGLVTLNQKDLTLKPCLAESWEVNDAATLYTFKIRKGVKFHDDPCFADGKGREVTAKDFKYCFDKLCSYAADNKGYDFVKERIVGAKDHYTATEKGEQPAGGVTGIRVLDDYTFQIELMQPFSSFLHIMAMPFGFVFPKEAVDKYGVDMRIKTVGTGPFFLKKVQENQTAILLRNPNYWGKDDAGNQLPYLDGIRFSFIGDKMQELREFKQGKFDMMYRLPLEVADEIVDRSGNLKGDYKEYQFQESPNMSLQYYGFLNNGELFKDKRLRQAFCYAVDREKIVNFTLKGAGFPGIYGAVPPAFAGYNNKALKGYDFNPDKARKLMEEAGHPNGEGLGEVTLQINSGGTRNEQVAEAIQKMLQENLNVNVKIVKMPFAQHLENTEAGKFNFWRAGWIADYPDPENFLNLFWSDHLPDDLSTGSVYLNTFRFKNADFDKYFEEALKTVDDAKRNELYLKADQVMLDEAALLPLFYDKDRRLLQKKVRNFPQNGMEYRNLVDVYFVPDGE